MSNGYGDISGQQAAKYAKEALRHAEPFIVLGKGAKLTTHPKKSTKSHKWRRVIPYAAATTPLTEGTAPSGTDFRYEEVTATLLQYGGYTPITDQLVDMHEAPVLDDINIQNAEQAARTKEALMWGVLGAATNIVYADEASSLATVDSPLTKSEQAIAVRLLERNKARKFTQIVKGGKNISTTPVEAAFLAFCHTDVKNDIRKMENFTPVAKYGSMKPISPHEFGAVDDVRYICSPDLDADLDAGEALATTAGNISNGGTDADVYTTIYCGMDAYAQVQLAGKGAFTPIVRMVGTPSASDPLGQTGSMGWKTYSDELILNQDWIVAVKHTVTEAVTFA
jgi:N4-gp56 family major capsid protein